MEGTLLREAQNQRFCFREHTLFITDTSGWITEGLQGLYERDMRLLSRYVLTVNGQAPVLDAYARTQANSSLAYYIAAPKPRKLETDVLGFPVEEYDRGVVLRVARSVGQGMVEEIELTNHSPEPARLALVFEVDADFADLVEVREKRRQQNAPIRKHWEVSDGEGELRIEYKHPSLKYGVIVRFCSSLFKRRGRGVMTRLKLEPQQSHVLQVQIAPVIDGLVAEPVYRGRVLAPVPNRTDHVRERWTKSATRLETTYAPLKLAWDRAIADLGDLALGEGETDAELAVPAAGMPFYGALFGRDVLTASGQAMIFSPLLAEGALRLLARHIGTKVDDYYDEQPGRVVQQVRLDPLALLGLKPWRHYYGDYAAPLAYLVLLGGYHVVTGNMEHIKEFLDPAERIIEWVRRYADIDGDGFLEYQTRSPQGQANQGWKDSGDAVVHADGRLAQAPIASCEIQGYWYAAQLLMAEVYLSLRDLDRAREIYASAQELKRHFNERFWMEEQRFVAYALDANKDQVKSIVSNVGHCLTTGIIERERVGDIVRRLMAPDMFSGWGIRTISSAHPLYNPLRYHLGSIWPPENATIAIGLRRYGFVDECHQLAKGMIDAASLYPGYALPETIGGFSRDPAHPYPGIYPHANAPQAWSAGAIGWFVQALLGLWTFAPLKVVLIDPALPEWLPDLKLYGLAVGDARVSIQFTRRKDGSSDYAVLENDDRVHVLRQPPPESQASAFTRLRDFVESLLPH